MLIYKFGGASVKDAAGIKNLYQIVAAQSESLVVVISAMGKTTNALEAILEDYFTNADWHEKVRELENYHLEVCADLFEVNHPVYNHIQDFTTELKNFLDQNTATDYDFVYDQIVPYGELMSTTIVSQYLNAQDMDSKWVDARQMITTNSNYREAKVDWIQTEYRVKHMINNQHLSITQGFIGGNEQGFSTTLGREGSDYSAGILAYCLNAEKVCIWKNVDGVLNADPREFQETILLEHISYQEAIELAFYGASVIHPKTLQPLQRKEIPLYVKSFTHPDKKGTRVYKGLEIIPEVPCFIVLKDLWLLSISTQDFSFFVEENMSEVFALFHQYQTKVHLIQHSAISFSVCIDNKYRKAEELIKHLQGKFKVQFNKGVHLYTIRHFSKDSVNQIRNQKTVLLEQHTRGTVQMVTKA